jgi:methylglutaconyl-CoA hydratase
MKHLICDIKNDVAEVSLNRPEVHNAFNETLIAELTDTFRDLAANDKVRVVVLSGEGKSFCAGADLNWMSKMKNYSMEQNIEDSRKLADMFHTINECPKAVIGKVHGAALGGGVGLVAVCDYVIATMDTKFGLTEVQLGLVPAVISPFVLAKMGESYARVWFMSGDRFTAERAEHMNLIHDTAYDHATLQLRTRHAVRDFLRAGPNAAREAKKLIADVQKLQGNREKLVQHTSEVIARLRVSKEGQEGMEALLVKTKPSWNKG